MNGHGKDQDEKIENLDLNDINLEVKIKPTEVKVENLDFETDPSISNTNTNVENNGFNDAAENLTDEQLSNEAFQDSKASDKMTTGENQDDQSAHDFPSNDQLQQSDDLVESGDQDDSFDEGDLKEPEAEEKNNEQSSNENPSDGQSNGEAPINDQTNSENSGENKEGGKSKNDNSENKKDDNNLNNNSENKKDGNNLSNDNPENKKDTNKDSREKNNRDNGQKNSDLNNKKDQDTSKTPQDNKNKNENSSPSKSNNNKPEMGNKEKKPSGLSKKRDDLKNKWNNRPKTPKDFANRAKNGIKNRAKNRYNNSRLGKAINNGKKAIQGGKKAAQKTKVAAKAVGAFLKTPAGLITLGVIVGLLLIFVLVIMVPTMFASGSPQIGGEVQDEENYSKYSEVDQKTIDKLKKISEKYASGNPSYAMAATLYPYIEEMQNGNVNSLRGKTTTQQEDEEDVYDDDDNNSDQSDNDELEESKNDTISNDPYLELFRKRKYRKKFEKLLKISKDGDDALTDFLKKTWFTKDAGYKELFDGVKDESIDALKEAIIEDILDQKDDFKGYFYDNCSTSYSTQSAGSVDFDDMLKGNILVDVKVSSCTTGKDVWDCESMYDTPIDMAKYTKGVTYEEIGVSGSSDVEKVKAQIVAAKSYVIGRSKSMGWGVRQDSAGNYIITIRANTNDQDYCDIDVGCKSGKTIVREGSAKRNAVDANARAKLDEAWEATKNVYIQSSNGALKGEFCNSRTDVCDFCKKGSCMAHQELEKYESVSYDKILIDQYSSYALVTIEGDFASAVVGTSSTTCNTEGGFGIPDDKFKFYYQTNYPNINFCGATDYTNGCPPSGKNTICTSGCGVTSYAMIVATLSQNENDFDPIKANEEANQSNSCVVGGGTKNTLFTGILNHHSGFSFENIPTTLDGASQVLGVLKKGGVVAANVQLLSPFTTGGHWIIIRGVTADGKVKVADPNSENRTITESYNIEDFISKNWLVDESGTKHQWYGIYGPKSNEFKTLGDAIVTGKLTYPIEGNKGSWSLGTIKSSDHLRYINGKYHGGNDISVSKGTTVLAMDGGEVIATDDTTNKGKDVVSEGYGHFGKFVSIKHEIEGKTYYSVYAHLDSISVKVGDKVSQGQEIGKSGNTGNSSGPHLHVAFSYDAYSYGSGAPIYNKNVIAPYIYITGSKKGQSYTSDVGSNY